MIFAPGFLPAPYKGNACGMLPVTFRRPTDASSQSPGRDALYATDDSMLTFWQPGDDDTQPWLLVNTLVPFEISAARIIWREIGLDYDRGCIPGPFLYCIEAKLGDQPWQCVLDASDNCTDLIIDYRPLERSVLADHIRLRILGVPKGIRPAVINFTIFGRCPD